MAKAPLTTRTTAPLGSRTCCFGALNRGIEGDKLEASSGLSIAGWRAATAQTAIDKPELVKFIPFDPAVKRRSNGSLNGAVVRVVKGPSPSWKDCHTRPMSLLDHRRRATSQGISSPGRRIWSSGKAANGWAYCAQRSSARGLRFADRNKPNHLQLCRCSRCDGQDSISLGSSSSAVVEHPWDGYDSPSTTARPP